MKATFQFQRAIELHLRPLSLWNSISELVLQSEQTEPQSAANSGNAMTTKIYEMQV